MLHKAISVASYGAEGRAAAAAIDRLATAMFGVAA